MSSEPRALLDLWRRKLAQGAGTIDLGGCGVEGTMVYWTDVLYERPDPDLAAFERGAGVGVAKSPEGHHGIRFRKSDSHRTRRWREPDSNPWSPLNRRRLGDHPWRLVRMRVRPKRPTRSLGGTDGSNPPTSSGESASRGILRSHGEKPAFRAGVRARQVQRGQQRRVSRGAWRHQAGISLSGQIPVPRRR